MVDTPTSNIGLREQSLGSNINTWGDDNLNEVLRKLDAVTASAAIITVSSPSFTITSSNFVVDQFANATYYMSGVLTANTVMVMPTGKLIRPLVVHAATSNGFSFGIKTLTGTTATVRPNIPTFVYTVDGTNYFAIDPTLDQIKPATAPIDFNGQQGINAADPTTVSGVATSNFVYSRRLDQFAVPTSNIDLNNNRLINVASGTSSSDGVNVIQVNTMIANAGLVATSGTVKVDASDTTAGYLASKLTVSGSIRGTVSNTASSESFVVYAYTVGSDLMNYNTLV